MTIEGSTLRLHDVGVNDEVLAGARSGLGRKAMTELRESFPCIICDGAIHPFRDYSNDDKPLLFWQAMLAEGLIDIMVLGELRHRDQTGAPGTARSKHRCRRSAFRTARRRHTPRANDGQG